MDRPAQCEAPAVKRSEKTWRHGSGDYFCKFSETEQQVVRYKNV